LQISFEVCETVTELLLEETLEFDEFTEFAELDELPLPELFPPTPCTLCVVDMVDEVDVALLSEIFTLPVWQPPYKFCVAVI
jgi:hypothetical protein